MQMQPQTQNSTQSQETCIDAMSQPIERFILGSVNPDADDLSWAGESDVQA